MTVQQIKELEKTLDSPKELQMLGAALVHTILNTVKPGIPFSSVRVKVVDPRTLAPDTGPYKDSVGGSVDSVVSVGWSKDVSKVPVNLRTMPKGLEAARRVKLTR